MTLEKTYWDNAQNPSHISLDSLFCALRNDDMREGLLYEPCTLDAMLESETGDPYEPLILDAIVAQYNKVDVKMRQMKLAMNRQGGEALNVVGYQVSDPFSRLGVANIAAIFELSDGQTVSIYFHNPDVTPKKISSTDEVVSYKWLLNKKDITIIVAPERGKDIDVRQVALRIMKLAEKNSAAFARQNKNREERAKRVAQLQKEVEQKIATLTALEKEIEQLERIKADEETDRLLAEETARNNQLTLQRIDVNFTEADSQLLNGNFTPTFSDINALQAWFEQVYPAESLDFSYRKVYLTVVYGNRLGEKGQFDERIDVGLTTGDFNPFKQHIADHLRFRFEQLAIDVGNVQRQAQHTVTGVTRETLLDERKPLTGEKALALIKQAEARGFTDVNASGEDGWFGAIKRRGEAVAYISGEFINSPRFKAQESISYDFTITFSKGEDVRSVWYCKTLEEAMNKADEWLAQFNPPESQGEEATPATQAETETTSKAENNPTDEPIVVTGNEFGEFDTSTKEGKAQLRSKVREYLETNLKGKWVHNTHLDRDIEIRQRSINKTLTNSANPRKLKLLAKIEEIIRTAQLSTGSIQNNYKQNHKTTATNYFHLRNNAIVDNTPIFFDVIIEEDDKGALHYDVYLDEDRAKRKATFDSALTVLEDNFEWCTKSNMATDGDITPILDDTQARYVLNLFLFDENGNEIPDDEWEEEEENEPIVVTGNEFGEFDTSTEEGKKALREKAFEHLNTLASNGDTVFCAALNANVGFTNNAAKKYKALSGNPIKSQIAIKIKEIIANSRIFKPSEESYDDLGVNKMTYHYLKTAVKVGENTIGTRIVVREDNNGKFHYDLQVKESVDLIVDSAEKENSSPLPSTNTGGLEFSYSEQSIPDTKPGDDPNSQNNATDLPLSEYGVSSVIHQEETPPVTDDITPILDDTQARYVLNLFLFDENGNEIPDEEWEEEDENEPIVVTGNEFGEFDVNTPEGKKALREKAVAHLQALAQNGETVFCPVLNAEVGFNRESWGKYKKLSADPKKLYLATKIKDIIRGGKCIYKNKASYVPAEQQRNITYDILETKVIIQGAEYTIKTTIRKLQDGKYQYDLQVSNKSELLVDSLENNNPVGVSANKSDLPQGYQEETPLVTDDITPILDDTQARYVLNLFLFDENGNEIPDEEWEEEEENEPIVVTGNEFGEFDVNTPEGKKALREKAVAHLQALAQNGETVFCPALNAEVGFNRESWSKFQRFSGDAKKLYLATKIKEIIERGKLIKSTESYDPRENAQGITYSVLETDVVISDVKYFVKTTIRKLAQVLQDGHYEYDLRVNDKSELMLDSAENKTLWETQLTKADLPQGYQEEPPLVTEDITPILDDTQARYVLNLFLFDENGNEIPDEEWEEEDENEPIVVTGNEFGEFDTSTEEGKKALREKAFEHLKSLADNGETVFCPALNADIKFSGKAAKKHRNRSTPIKDKLSIRIKEIIAASKEFMPSKESYDTNELKMVYHYLKTSVKVGKQTYGARIVIREDHNGKFHYDLQVKDSVEAIMDSAETNNAINLPLYMNYGDDSVIHQEETPLVTDNITPILDDTQARYVLNLFLFDENGNEIPDDEWEEEEDPTSENQTMAQSPKEFAENVVKILNEDHQWQIQTVESLDERKTINAAKKFGDKVLYSDWWFDSEFEFKCKTFKDVLFVMQIPNELKGMKNFAKLFDEKAKSNNLPSKKKEEDEPMLDKDKIFLQDIIDGKKEVMADGFHKELMEIAMRHTDNNSEMYALLEKAVMAYESKLDALAKEGQA